MSLVLNEHRQYLADRVRLDAFSRAIAQTVRSGDVVVDLGAGTGILGLMACRAGAARVYGIEVGPIAGLARELATANGYGDRVIMIRELSTEAVLPELADVVVTDQIGPFGFDGRLLDYLLDARARFLKPGGRMIPTRLILHVCPCVAPQIRSGVETWSSRPGGFDFDLARRMACSTGYGGNATSDDLLASPAPVATIDPSGGETQQFEASVEFDIVRAGPVDALCAWFVAELVPGIEMTNAPHVPDRLQRKQLFFPLDQTIAVAVGDRVHVRMHIWPLDLFISWEVELWRCGAAAPVRLPRQSTFGSMLMSREDLALMRRDVSPHLSPAGRARLSVLQLADGTHTVEEIERIVAERHADHLPTHEAAAAVVARVLTRYAE